MAGATGKRAAVSAIPAVLTAVVGLFAYGFELWSTLGVPGAAAPHFGDLRVVLAGAECATNPGWSLAADPCDERSAIYNYPSLWARGFALFGVGQAQAATVAIALILLFAASLWLISFLAYRPEARWPLTVGLSIAAVSPPVLLAFERGNIDLAVFAVTGASIGSYVATLLIPAGVLLGLAMALKLFPAGGAIMLLQPLTPPPTSRPSTPRRDFGLAAFVVVAAVGSITLVADLPFILARTPRIDGASFGASLLPTLINGRLSLGLSNTMLLIAGLIAFAVSTLVVSSVLRRWTALQGPAVGLVKALAEDRISSTLVLAGTGVFLFAYVFGPSYDYRLVFLIPAIAGFLRITTRASLVLAGTVLLQLLLSYSTFVGAAEYLSDLMWLLLAPALLILAIATLQAQRPSPSERPPLTRSLRQESA